jgi:hypothetical protein
MRYRCQFSLGSLLAFTAAMAVCATFYGARYRAVQAQEQAFRAIAARGGEIYVYGDGTSIFFERPPLGLCGSGLNRYIPPAEKPTPFSDADLTLFDYIIDLDFVSFAGSAVTSKGRATFASSHKDCHTEL